MNTQINGLPMDNAGKGEQCLVKTALSFSVPGTSQAERIILIEEPECHLSHSTLNILLDMINEEAKKYQIITTTHSSFVANKLGLNSLIMLNHSKSMRLSDLNKETAEFFEKVAGYDTLRLVLSKKAVLVEGDSDELIFQRAYMNKHDGKLPIQNGIDVISVGLAFKRFLSIAKELDIPVFVLTDNDGKIDELKKKYINFMQCPNIKISYPDNINDEDTFTGFGNPKSLNTLEPEIVKANRDKLPQLAKILEYKFDNELALIEHMESNKTESAWKIFKAKESITFPKYIESVVKMCNE